MTWFKIDDAFWAHPKTMSLSPEAIALWVRAGSWSCQQLTDGIIPDRSLPLFAASSLSVAELVEVGFWHEIDGGHEFHDWDEYQETSEIVKERRAKARERMKVVRANRERTKSERAQEQNAKFAESSLNPDPTRPDPTTTPNGVVKTPPAVAARELALPEPFIVTRAMRGWAAEKVPTVDVDRATEAFVDYWRGRAGKGARKADWEATWRNSLRSAVDRGQHLRAGAPRGGSQMPADRAADVIEMGRQMDRQQGEIA